LEKFFNRKSKLRLNVDKTMFINQGENKFAQGKGKWLGATFEDGEF